MHLYIKINCVTDSIYFVFKISDGSPLHKPFGVPGFPCPVVSQFIVWQNNNKLNTKLVHES